jgi:tripartite-type tricarboxylate transporter receptor subunit TctC
MLMHYHRRRFLSLLAATPILGIGLGKSRDVLADVLAGYPSRPLRIIVPFSPGSGSDVYARYFGQRLSEQIGQPVIVENRPGAGGAIAVNDIKSAPADGHTILLGSNSPMAVNVSVYNQLPYDPLKDLRPLSGLSRSMAVLVVPSNSPMKSIDDLVARGKQHPPLNMGTYSAGYQLAAAPFLEKAGFKWADIGYKGLGQTTSDVIGGQVDIAVIDTPGSVALINGGKMRALAVTGTERHPEMPDVPTLVESGYPDAVHYSWTSLWMNSATPDQIVSKIASQLSAILNESASKTFVADNGGEIMPYGPKELRTFQEEEIQRFARAVDSLDFQKIQ